MKFRAKVIPSGNATAVEVPAKIAACLGVEARPPVKVTINGHFWRSRIAAMRGTRLIGISAANRSAAGIAEGETVEIAVERDDAPRVVDVPTDVARALRKAGAMPKFTQLPFGLKRKYIADIDEAKSPETRARRIASLVKTLDQVSAKGA